MAVETTNVCDEYVGNNSTTTPYPISFDYLLASDITVTVDEELYTNIFIGEAGLVTGDPIPSSSSVVITRVLEFTQPDSFDPNTRLSIRSVENSIDRVVMLVQQIAQFDLEGLADALATISIFQIVEESEDFEIRQEHVNALVRVNSTDPVTITLPNSELVQVPFMCTITRIGSGAVNFITEDGIILDSDGTFIFGRNTGVAVYKVAGDRYQIHGDLY